jgi:hypothetical protein
VPFNSRLLRFHERADGGVKGGLAYGTTDEFGFKAVENRVHVHDFHATILHLMGLDHERLTHRYSGRDFRLTDVHGKVVEDIIAVGFRTSVRAKRKAPLTGRLDSLDYLTQGANPKTSSLFPRETFPETRSAELHSAVSKNCILRAADRSGALEHSDALPITNRRYSRVQLCAASV